MRLQAVKSKRQSVKQNSKYWYMTYIHECPLCGRSDRWRERMYTSKPPEAKDRVSLFYITLCQCYYGKI